MSLIIALVLITIVLCKVGSDKSKAAVFDREKSKRDSIISDWEDLYVSRDLEASLRRCIADERNYAAVREEVSKVLSTKEHWRYLSDGDFVLNESQISGVVNYKQAHETLRRNQTIALDIMLANRGKVSAMAAAFGYKAYKRSGTLDLKESAYEYAETILKLMRLRDAKVKLYYYRHIADEAYYWEGTHPYHRNNPSRGEYLTEFEKALIFLENPIPPII